MENQQSIKKSGISKLVKWAAASVILIAVITTVWVKSTAGTSSPSSPAQIAAQLEFQQKLIKAQNEYQQKIDSATKIAELKSR
jgi:hypothetical protein